ncbi:PREDICTED: protein ELYS [Nanorana parkeri]|uniref:protein ELYS n=1 Tax=Nanorana parkeri TaxID=125878 RepID=UPI000854BC51|nr:PREDICTED: protein ELYS [Nanorana parkeri]
MQNLSAQVTSDFLQFPDATVKALEEDDIQLDSVLRAKFSTGKAGLAWLACGPQLEVTNAVTGERLSAYHFSGVTERPPTVVTVKEFSWQKKTGLLVGLVEAESSVLCLYDVGISRVVKAVVVPGSVTSVEPIINHGGASASTQHLHQSLRWFFGVAAVVTDVGHVLLIDLCMDDVSGNQDEMEASDLEVMSGIPAEIPKLREAASRERRHLCLQLLAPSGTSVTALSFISRTNQLAVGFSDGYLSLWNMKTLRREYHVQIEGGKVPVSAVTFQEPENDPRNCCYLWAVQATQSGKDISLHLLQLAFGDRKCLASGQIIYEHLEYCEERYSLDLSASSLSLSLRSQTNSTKLLGCQTIEKFRAHSEREDGLHEVSSPDTSVTIFSWQVSTYGHGKPSIYMAVFDINRWYQAQMPDSLRPGQFLRNCSYIAFWSLEAVVNVTQDSIFDMLVHERSFSRGAPTSYPPPEQFFYPSTYNFDATCLLSSGLIHITCTGFQKETLYFLKNSGSSLNETIPDGYSRCLVAGLLSPRLADVQPSSLSQEEQLQAVLSTAVETSSISLLTRCIKLWTAEEQPRSATNLRFVLEWTWNKVSLVKREFDRLCLPLFDGSCNFIDPQTLHSLHHCQLRLRNLTTVLNCFITEAQELTKQGLIDLANKQSVTKLLAQYASIVLWFCRCGLLPDYSDEAMQLTRPCYNYNRMQQYYAERRKKLDNVSRGKWNASSLMIDGMVCHLGEKVEQLWKRDGGTGKYPPATLHALLDLYLLENADEISKHAITIYFLLDIMYSFPDKPDSAIESFPTAFSVPCGLVKLIQGFWLLDHNDYQNSLDCILHPAASRVMSWQHNQIIETLLCQGDYRQALRYIQVMKPPAVSSADVRLHITVLLANKNLIEAWNLQRLHSTRLNVEELLKHMYEACQEMGLMEDLLKLTFTDCEQGFLQRFLQTTGGVQNQELLLVHHLQRANYIPALQLNQSLKGYQMFDSDRKLRERAVARNAIIDQYSKTLPGVQRTLAGERTKHSALSSTIWKEVTRPKPLSTVVKQAPSGSVMSKATFISNVLMKIKEVSSTDVQMDFSPYKSLPTEEQNPVTALPHLEVPDAFISTPVSKSRRVSRLLESIVHPVLTEPLPRDADFEMIAERTPRKSCTLMTSSPIQSNLRKIAHLRNLTKASEFNLLETPIIVKRAKALAASSVSSVFTAHTPQSILRSSTRTTPLASPSVSPGRSITPPLRPRESKISFMEQISNKYVKGVLTPDKDLPVSSPLIKSAQDTIWPERMALSLSNTSTKEDLDELDESSSGIQDGSTSKVEASREASNISARSDQTTLEYHDAPTPEDMEDEVVTITAKSEPLINKESLPSEVVNLAKVEMHLQELQDQDKEEANTDHHSLTENYQETLHQLTTVQEIVPPLQCALEEVEDNAQTAGIDPESFSSTRDSPSVVSIHDCALATSSLSEHLNEENEVVELNGDVELQEDKYFLVQGYPMARAPLSRCVEESRLFSISMLELVSLFAAPQYSILSLVFSVPGSDLAGLYNLGALENGPWALAFGWGTFQTPFWKRLAVEHFPEPLASSQLLASLKTCLEIKEKEVPELELMTSNHLLHPAVEFQVDYNAENIEDHNRSEQSNDGNSMETEDAEVENAASNFTLILEEEGEAEEDETADKVLKADHPADTELTTVSKISFSLTEEYANQEIKSTDTCPANAFTLVDGEQETKIMETLPYVPKPIKVAVEENLLDVFRGTSVKDFSSEVDDESAQENEPIKKRRSVHTSRTPTKRRGKKSEDVGVENIIQAATPQKKLDVQSLKETLETSPKKDESVVVNPQTPRRTVRKSTRITEGTSADIEAPLPVTPRRGRKAKVNEEKLTVSTSQEEQPSSQIFTRNRSQVPEKNQNTEVELTSVEVTVPLPLSPARTRRGKAPILDQVNKGDEDLLDLKVGVLTPTRITRSSKVIPEAEKELLAKNPETETEQVTTPTRGRRGKRAVNELVKQFELNVTQTSYKADSSPPGSPKRVSLRWSRIKSEKQIDHQTAEQENTQSQEQIVDTPRKSMRRSKVSKLGEESTDLSERSVLPPEEPALTKATKQGNVSIRQTRKRTLPAVSEESVEERLHALQPVDSQDMVPNADPEEQTKSMRITRTRLSNASLSLDPSTALFAFTTPTPRRRKNAKVEPVALSISPGSIQPPITPQYIFSPPSLRTRRTTRKVPQEQIIKRPRGRPPKHKGSKAEKPVDKATWSPPPVEIQLLSPPESPNIDSEGAKSASTETKALNQNQQRKTRRRIASKPVTRRKIR